jgi:hypothetical protein
VLHALAQRLLEQGQLGAQDQPLEHRSGLAVERQHTAAEAIDETR